MILRLLPIVAVACLTASSCKPKSTPAVPKPEAYARVAEYDSVYVAADSLPIHFETNAEAILDRPSYGWLNATYKAYDATVFITFISTSADSIGQVMANRRQRIDLNIPDKSNLQISEINSDEFNSMLVKSEQAQSTPLQFLSTDGKRWVVSGAVFFHNVNPGAPTDSLAPMVKIIERDLIHALSTISVK